MKRQYLFEQHNRQDRARKPDYQADIYLDAYSKQKDSDWEKWRARRLGVLASVREASGFIREFEDLFSGARISFQEREKHSSRTHSAWTFDAEIGLYGRYILEAHLPIMVDSNQIVVSTTHPQLNIRMVREIIRQNSRFYVSYEPNSSKYFGLREWMTLVGTCGDFSAIGYDMVKDAPLPDFAAFCHCSGYVRR